MIEAFSGYKTVGNQNWYY